jgi:hypothetical protein
MVIEYVYGLLTKEKEYIYVGITNNPEVRVEHHDMSIRMGKMDPFYEMIILDKYEDREQFFIDKLEKEGFDLKNKVRRLDVPSREYHIGESLSRERVREKMIYQRSEFHRKRWEEKKKKLLRYKRRRRKLYHLRPDKGFPPIGVKLQVVTNKRGSIYWRDNGKINWDNLSRSSNYRYNIYSLEDKLLESGLMRRQVMDKYGMSDPSPGMRKDYKGDKYRVERYTI